MDFQTNSNFPPPSQGGLDRYQSFSLLLQPIPTRFELNEMCNLWDRDVTVSFDLHVGGSLLQPFILGDARGTIRSLNKHVGAHLKIQLIAGTSCLLSIRTQS